MRREKTHDNGGSWAATAAYLFLTLGCTTPRQEIDPRSVRYYEPPAQAYRSTKLAEPTTSSPAAGCSTEGRIFPASSWVNRSVAAAARARDSDRIVRFLETSHQEAGRFRVDFSLVLLEARRSTARRTFKRTAAHYIPDCDLSPVPLPAGGRLEGERGYACNGDGDCHLLVLERDECRLYEMFRADVRGNTFEGGCLAVWNLTEPYPQSGRGEDCTSADAAGLPIAPLLFSTEDLARGEINHALRFVLPNSLIRQLAYVTPGTHSTKATEGPASAPPYAALLRLRGDVDLGRFKPGARVVLTALQTYGMYLADGGRITFTAASDATDDVKWSDVGFGAHDLEALRWTDFEVVDSGEPRVWQGKCTRRPITD